MAKIDALVDQMTRAACRAAEGEPARDRADGAEAPARQAGRAAQDLGRAIRRSGWRGRAAAAVAARTAPAAVEENHMVALGRRGFVGGAAALSAAALWPPRPGRAATRWASTRPAICCRAPPSARRRLRSAPSRRWTTPRRSTGCWPSLARQRADAGAGLDQRRPGRAAPPAAGGAAEAREGRRRQAAQDRAPGPGAGARAAQLVGRGDARHRPAAGRADDAVLAQPFHLVARRRCGTRRRCIARTSCSAARLRQFRAGS